MDIKEATQILVKSGENFSRNKYVPWWNEDKDGMYRYDLFTDAEISEINALVESAPNETVFAPVGTYKYTLFHLLVWHNFYDAVKSVIARKIDVDTADGGGKGITPLMLACSRTNLKMAELLVKSGADVMRADASGRTCWHYIADARPDLAFNTHCREASADQRAPIAELLGNNFDKADANGKTPLAAVLSGNANFVSCAIIDILLAKGAKTDYRAENGDTLLMLAIKNNHNTAALRLASDKSLVNAAGANGDMPLKVADDYRKAAVCMTLKANGATGESRYDRIKLQELKQDTSNAFAFSPSDKDNLAPALYLVQKLINTIDEDDDDELDGIASVLPDALGKDEKGSVLDMLLKAGISLTDTISSRGQVYCLRDKCFSMRAGVAAIKKLKSLGVDIDSAIVGGKTPVHIVAEQPEPYSFGREKFTYFEDAARLFSSESMTALDNGGVSAMHTAARLGHTEMLRAMVESGADVNVTQDAPAKAGNTPLHAACERYNAAAAKMLISLGADDGIKNVDGETAAHLTAKKSSFGMGGNDRDRAEKNRLEILGALKTTDEPRGDGMTPLMLLQYENIGFILHAQPILLDGGADVNRRDNRGRTALIIAASEHCYKDTLKELVRAGADVNVADKDGKTALHYALRYGSQDVARYLVKKGADYNRADNNGTTAAMLAAEKGYDTVLELMTDIS